MFWVNGVPQTHVELGDRSFQYGDGGFTTILTQNGELVYWQEHIERMRSCLDALKISSPDWQVVHDWASKAALSDAQAGGVKIHVSRGIGGRGIVLMGLKALS